MIGCLYFVPARRFQNLRVQDAVKAKRLTPEGALSLEDIGLAHLDGAPVTYRGVLGAGPDGGAGLVIGLRTPANETGFWGDQQQWRPVDGGGLFIGWAAGDTKPGPDVFLRDDALPSEADVVMADGNTWGFVPTVSLPEVMGCGPDGGLTFRPRAKDTAHFAASAWLKEYASKGEPAPWLDVLQRIAVCLGARYHVGLIEVLALELFSTELLNPVVFACLGITEKKTD